MTEKPASAPAVGKDRIMCPFLRMAKPNRTDFWQFVSDCHANGLGYAEALAVSLYILRQQKGLGAVFKRGETIDMYRLDEVPGTSHTDLFRAYLPAVEGKIKEVANKDGMIRMQDLVDIKKWIAAQEGVEEVSFPSKAETGQIFVRAGGDLDTGLVAASDAIKMIKGERPEKGGVVTFSAIKKANTKLATWGPRKSKISGGKNIVLFVAVIAFAFGLYKARIEPTVPLFVKTKAIAKMEGLSEDNRNHLKEMDAYTCAIAAVLPSRVLHVIKPSNDTAVKTDLMKNGWKNTGDDFGDWEKSRLVIEDIKLKEDTSIVIPTDDDIFGEMPGIYRLLRWKSIFPLVDKTHVVEDKQAESIAKDVLLLEANPTPYLTWKEMSSDEAMSRIFFYGIGSLLMLEQSAEENKYKELGPFVVDLDLSGFEVREKYRHYGFRAHFDGNQTITAIYDYAEKRLVKPEEGRAWEAAKFLAKQTTMAVITGREHLFWTHAVLSNTMSRTVQANLPPSHPIRRLLSVFTVRTNFINQMAGETLFPELSIFHRMSGLTSKSIVDLFDLGYKTSSIFEPFADKKIGTDLKRLSDEGLFPFYSEGVAYFGIVHSFVSEWLEKAGSAIEDEYATAFYNDLKAATKGQKYEILQLESKDDKINALSQMIFAVTAYHEMAGTVVDYLRLPSFMGFRIIKDETSSDLQSYLIASALTASTGVRMPSLVGEFANYFGVSGAPEWEKEVWKNFQDMILEQSKNVRAADEERIASGKPEFKNMDPARFECSVSL